MCNHQSIIQAIREEHLDGWLFYNLAHRDPLTDTILNLDIHSPATRPWVYAVLSNGNHVKIVSTLEPGILDSLPGERYTYQTRDEWIAHLSRFSHLSMAILSDEALPSLSTLPDSFATILRNLGTKLVSAATAIQRAFSILDSKGIESHEVAAHQLYAIVENTAMHLCRSYADGKTLTEGDIQDYILEHTRAGNLESSDSPIVAAGKNSANPHYEVPGHPFSGPRGKVLCEGDVLQIDLWACQKGGIYADISWVFVYGTMSRPELDEAFSTVSSARDMALDFILSRCTLQEPITGCEVDAKVREFLLSKAPQWALRHRTGHSIDRFCHGLGANLDSTEFPDSRYLLEGSLFSVEPGLYYQDFGFRTEINVYMSEHRPIISGGLPQERIITMKDR